MFGYEIRNDKMFRFVQIDSVNRQQIDVTEMLGFVFLSK